MTAEERGVIVSNEHVDLIINYRSNPQLLADVPSNILQYMNESYAVIYAPISTFSNRSIGFYGYSIVPQLCGLTSEVSLEASGIDELRNISTLNLRGSGVLIGIIDTGVNYNLPVFKKADGTSKIYSIWDQTIQSENYPFNTMFGTEYSRDQINQAIASQEPLSIVPSNDDNGHGTMLASIAAGTDLIENNFYGVAPEAELVVVKLLPAKKNLTDFFLIPEGVPCYQENSVMWGLQYCIETARMARRPIAICLGIGTAQGPHDGSSPLGSYVSLLSNFPRTGIVTSVGNEGNLGRHFYGEIDPSVGSRQVELNVSEEEKGFSMELWGNSPGIFSLDILSPSGEYIPRIAASLKVNREIAFIFDSTVIHLEYQTVETGIGDQLIILRFENVSAGIWRFNVFGQSNLTAGFHIWLPMGRMLSENTRFIQPNIYSTVMTPSTAEASISVTAYNPISTTLFVNSSRGYTRSNAIKPDFAAPGVNYIASNQNGEFQGYSGTGVAAAHTTGITALMLEWGEVLGNQPNISSLEIKNYFIRGAKRSSNLTYPNRDWGFGTINIYNTFNVLRQST